MFLPIMSFLIPVVVAFLLLHRFWPEQRFDLWLKIGLVWPLGVGLGSSFFFVWSLLFNPAGKTMIAVEMLLSLAAIAALIVSIRNRDDSSRPLRAPSRKPPWWSVVALAAASLLGSLTFLSLTNLRPHGFWDAWAIWNLRARFLYRSAEHWTDTFSPDLFWSSPDYPLNLPGMIARCWKYFESESTAVPAILAFLFTAATVWITVAVLARLRGPKTAMLGGLCLLGTPLLITHGAAQYADVPVACYMLAATALLALHDERRPVSPAWLFWAGVMASLAAWTKNEGILLLVALAAGRAVFLLRRRGLRASTRELGRLTVGAAPVLLLVLILKLFLVPPSGLFAIQDSTAIWAKLTEPARYWVVIQSFAAQMSGWGHGVSVAMVGVILLAWPRWSSLRRDSLPPLLVTLLVMLVGYFMIYVITPQDQDWHLATSVHRILLQVWPMTVLLFGLGPGSLDDA